MSTRKFHIRTILLFYTSCEIVSSAHAPMKAMKRQLIPSYAVSFYVTEGQEGEDEKEGED